MHPHDARAHACTRCRVSRWRGRRTSGQKGSTQSWKREKPDGTSQSRRHFSIEPKMLEEGAVRKLARAMPTTMPTCEQTGVGEGEEPG
jgi:hypothetical protein